MKQSRIQAERPVSSPTPRQQKRTRWLALAAPVLAILLAAPTLAYASAYSAWSYRTAVGAYYGCAQAPIVDVADHRAYSGRTTYSSCTLFVHSSPGYLGAQAFGYKDGAFCASTSFPVNAVTTTTFGIGSNGLCSNPAGLQNFWTCAKSKFYDGSVYLPGGSGPCSPEQSY